MSDQNENYFEEILDKFLKGTHSESELDALKKATTENPMLHKKLSEHLEARANIRIAGESELKVELVNAYDKIDPQQTVHKIQAKEKSNLFRWMAVAASVAALVMAGFYLWPSAELSDPVTEFLDNPPVITVRGQQKDDFTTTWKQGELAYQNKSFEDALQSFEALDKFPEASKAHFGKIAIYKGFIFLQQNKYDEAINQFKSIPTSNPLLDEATWYLANTYLKKGDKEQAKETLNQIISHPMHYKHKAAKTLLESIQ